ncbi:hypothetical protein LCGC14_1920350 [marine sediment metagenome]|uniref:Bacteriophage Mu GpT domain-containing protein n=1 Tax=marine sediment metagenome TaxID=412755 RepID=A0A0F9GEC1_9ZZZZ
MSITDREMTSTTHQDFLPTVWADDTRDAIKFAEVLSKLVNTQYEDDLTIGRVLNIPLRANYNTQTKTEGLSGAHGNDVNFQSMAGNNAGANFQAVTVSTFEYAAALLNAVVAAQSKYDERQNIASGLGYALMRGVEVGIAALPQSFSQITGTLGADPDDAVLRRSWQYLADAGVYDGANWIFGPSAVAALFGNNKFTSKDFVDGASVIENATLPRLYNHPAFASNLLRAPASGQTECFLAHREAIILLRQVKPQFREQFDIRKLADGIVAYNLYTTVEANWSQEAPAGDSNVTKVDQGAVLIRTG